MPDPKRKPAPPIPPPDPPPSPTPLPYAPLPNYTLSTVCPRCGSETFRQACKVRCGACGFAWDCSEL
jgi:hypothetical protein